MKWRSEVRAREAFLPCEITIAQIDLQLTHDRFAKYSKRFDRRCTVVPYLLGAWIYLQHPF